MIRVILADDHELVLEGLRSLLEHEEDLRVLATATNGTQLLESVARHTPDVVVLDLDLPDVHGVECIRRLRKTASGTKVLVLTAYSDGQSMQSAIEAGADGFALKTQPPQQTLEAIRQVFQGQLVFPQAAKRWLIGGTADRPAGAKDELTIREREILELVAEGLTNAQIAARLRVSENTIKFHLQNTYLKLGVSNRTEAASLYYRRVRPAPITSRPKS